MFFLDGPILRTYCRSMTDTDQSLSPLDRVLAKPLPLIAAPMAGGVTTPDLVIEAGKAGGLGFFPLGYLPLHEFERALDGLRRSGLDFGVNLFVPTPLTQESSDREENLQAISRYASALTPQFEHFGVEVPSIDTLPGLTGKTSEEEWKRFNDALGLLLKDPPPVVSFTFGAPPKAVVDRLHQAGSAVLATVTSVQEAEASEKLGVDGLIVQGSAAGGHSAIWDGRAPVKDGATANLVAKIAGHSELPLIAAGGVASPQDVEALLEAGATSVAVGTLLMRADEAGTSPLLRDALVSDHFKGTVLTRAFTGRLARSLTNRFAADFQKSAPSLYPATHYLTAPLRKAATDEGDPQWVNLWAGEGHKNAPAEPTSEILAWLAGP